MRSVVTKAASLSSIVLPSFEDEAVVFGDASPLATIERYTDAGAIEVVVKKRRKHDPSDRTIRSV